MATQAQIDAALEERRRRQVAQAQAELDRRRSGTDFGDPVVKDGKFQVGGKATVDAIDIADPVLQHVEPAVTMATGAVGETVGNLAGGAQMLWEPARAAITGDFQNPLAAQQVRDYVSNAMTYQPRSEGGKRMLGNIAQFMQPVAEVVEAARLGDEVLDADLPLPDSVNMGLAASAEAIPEYLGAFLGARGMPAQKPMEVKFPTGMGDVKAARLIKTPKGMQKYPPAMKAHKQGWSDEVITVARSGSRSPGTQKKLQEMIQMAKRAKSDPVWGATNRPSQVLGDSVVARYRYLKDINQKAGQMIDRVAKDFLVGKQVDHAPAIQKFYQGVKDLGGRRVDGKLVFPRGSRLHGQAGNQKGLRVISDQIDAMGPAPDAYQLHILKQNIDDFVSYGKKPGSVSALSGKTETLLKSLRGEINAKLKGASNNYDTVNTMFSDTKDAITGLGEAVGKNLYGDSATIATGETMRRWIGRAQSRGPIIQAYEKADDIAAKYGARFDDVAEPQILMSNILDDFLTDPKMRATAKADFGGKTAQMIERSTLHNVATAADDAINRLRGVDDIRALKALEELVSAGQ